MHARVIEETGGLDGVRDVGMLAGIAERPKARFDGKALYLDLFSKAAAYFESVVRNHVFADGNKRTAVMAAGRFLFVNGYELSALNREVESFTLRVAREKLDIKVIAEWFRRHSRKLRK